MSNTINSTKDLASWGKAHFDFYWDDVSNKFSRYLYNKVIYDQILGKSYLNIFYINKF